MAAYKLHILTRESVCIYVCADVLMYVFDRSVLSQGQNGRKIFVVDRDQRRGIPTLDSFLALNFSMADGTVMSDVKLSSIPVKIRICIHTISH